MKIRQTFVSNSSSSSFLYYGISASQKELVDMLLKVDPGKYLSEYETEEGIYEAINDDIDGVMSNLGFSGFWSESYDEYVIGFSCGDLESISTNELLNGFIDEDEVKRIDDLFAKMTTKKPHCLSGTEYC